MSDDRYALTVMEAADTLRVHRRTIERMIVAGILPSAKICGRRLIPAAALRELFETNIVRRSA